MKILISEDDLIPRRVLMQTLINWGYTVESTSTGEEAWAALQEKDAAKVAILDWMLPDINGIEICKRVRSLDKTASTYILLLTGRREPNAVVEGLESGANDFIQKPFDPDELRARLKVACMVVDLQSALSQRIAELESALKNIKELQELLPICCYCKKIRNDENYWQQVEHYFAETAGMRFSHGICPGCLSSLQRQFQKSNAATC